MKFFRLTHVLLALGLVAANACRSPDELNEIITAQVFVIGVDDDQWVELEIDDQVIATESDATADLLQFSLALEPGSHEGTITVFELQRKGRPDDDDRGWHRPDDDEIEALRCGTFSLEIPEQMSPAATVSIAIVVDNLQPCLDEDGDEERERASGDDDGAGMNDAENDLGRDAAGEDPENDPNDPDDDPDDDSEPNDDGNHDDEPETEP